MKVVMKRSEVFSLWVALNHIKKEFGFKVAYAISKNKKKLQEEIDSVNEAVKPKPEFEEYDKERVELAKKHSSKDAAGQPVVKRTQIPGGGVTESYDLTDMEAFEKEHLVLRNKYKDVVDAQDKRIKERNDSMNDNVEMDLHCIESSLLDDPKMNFTIAEMDALSIFVVESPNKDQVYDIKKASALKSNKSGK